MEVIHDLLGYDGLKIYQDSDAFSFSIDSLLLASFIKANNAKNIIDLCTGNAPIPLFLTLKTDANIIGVEIQEYISTLPTILYISIKLEFIISILFILLISTLFLASDAMYS